MTLISVVVPTISGREDTFARCVESYERTLDGEEFEIVVVKDMKNWPTACNAAYKKTKGDIIHFTADDLEAVDGWHVEAIKSLKARDELPAPRVYDHELNGHFHNEVDGVDGQLTRFTRIPICTRDQYERIGIWPDMDYNSDIWFSERGRILGIETRMIYSYTFIHHWSGVGRLDSEEQLAEAHRLYVAECAAGYPPIEAKELKHAS